MDRFDQPGAGRPDMKRRTFIAGAAAACSVPLATSAVRRLVGQTLLAACQPI